MSSDIASRIVDREVGYRDRLLVEAVLLRPSAAAKYWWVKHLEMGEVVRSERFVEESKARERWADIHRSYAGGAS